MALQQGHGHVRDCIPFTAGDSCSDAVVTKAEQDTFILVRGMPPISGNVCCQFHACSRSYALFVLFGMSIEGNMIKIIFKKESNIRVGLNREL